MGLRTIHRDATPQKQDSTANPAPHNRKGCGEYLLATAVGILFISVGVTHEVHILTVGGPMLFCYANCTMLGRSGSKGGKGITARQHRLLFLFLLFITVGLTWLLYGKMW